MNAQEIRDLFKKHNVNLSQNDVWEVQGNPVVKHKALERLAGALKVAYDAPQILRAERDEAVILVSGKLPSEAAEWSIGEAVVNVNYKVSGKMAAYVYAMAEKRAKDRVILKLAGLHGVYSEDEADDFKEPQRQHEAITHDDGKRLDDFRQSVDDTLRTITTTNGLTTYWRGIASDIPASIKAEVTDAFASRKAEIENITKDAA